MKKLFTVVFNDEEYPDYLITKKGNIFSKKYKNNKVQLTPSINNNSHSIIRLYKQTETKTMIHIASIHRILACTFKNKTDDDIRLNRNIVHFKDWDPMNIDLSNLVWVNCFEMSILRKIKNNNYNLKKLSQFKSIFLSKFIDNNYNQKDISKFFKTFKEYF